MQKIIFSFSLVFFFFLSASAQVENPVKWSYSAKKISDKLYELHVTATIADKWHIYAQDAGTGPEPTSIKVSPNPLVKIDGKVKEVGKLESSYDPNFKSTLRYYSNQVDFVQRIKLKSVASTIVKGTLSYMVCNDKKCLPPKDVPFSIKVAGK